MKTFVSTFSTNFDQCTAFRAKILALTKGLKLIRQLQIDYLKIELDSLTCMQIFKQNGNGRGERVHDLDHCCGMI